MSLAPQRSLRFGPFRLDPDTRLLFRNAERLLLRPRVFETLLVLARSQGELVTKEELLDAVWPDTVVEENNLSQNILALRRLLERHAEDGVRIETLPRRGYRLLTPFTEQVEPPTLVAAPPPVQLVPSEVSPAPLRASRRLRIAAVLFALSAASLALAWIWKANHAPRRISGVHSIAVLPLTAGSGRADEYLGLGLADAVITRLGYIQSLSVRPTSAIRSYRSGAEDPSAAGRRLGVDAVLDGQFQKSGDRLRVTLQLIGTRTGSALWSEKFDVKASDLFSVEDAISESIARALTSSLSEGEARHVGRDRQTSPEAYRAYLEGRYFWNERTEPATWRARALFERAIALDPAYAPAFAGLADTLNSLHARGVEPRLARQAAERALALDDSLAEAYASLGNTSLFSEWNITAAETDLRRALDLNPSYATARQWIAYCDLARGRLAAALQEIRRAQQTDPLSPSISVDVGLMLFYARRYDAAIAEYRRVLEFDPKFEQARDALILALDQEGDVAAAGRECSQISSADPGSVDGCLALVAAHAGLRSEAEERVRRITHPEHWYWEARVFVALGDRDRAMAALEEGFRLRSSALLLVGADPGLERLRSDPRFTDLMRRVGIRPVEPTQL